MAYPGHYVAIFGGAVSGAEAANQLAQRGINVVIFEQNTLPYGKIEDGLPKWHAKLRDKEEGNINEKMNNPLIKYVPDTALGKDIDVADVARNWGFSAVLMATGAWKDRPLPIDGIDQYENNGLYYQNPFIYWVNHCHEPNFDGQSYDILDETIVVGGGLASIDVCKALMMFSVENKLRERGIETNMLELDRGIDKVLDVHGLTLNDLGIKGCTLYYRRRDIDMPLSPMATDTPEMLEKAQTVRKKVLENAMNKFGFKFQGNRAPAEAIVENGRLAGLKFQETEVVDGKLQDVEGAIHEVRGGQVISSIGSIPVPIEGVPMNGQVYQVENYETCRIDGFDNLFAVGNAVTGQGNIKASFQHGKEMGQKVMDDYIGWNEEDFQNYLRAKEEGVANEINAVADYLGKQNLLSNEKIQELDGRIAERQQAVGYDGNYNSWVEKHLPQRLEDMVGAH